MRLLERVVRPDWVCLDIGANIGAHTLALAVLACRGEVFAFEASGGNFGYLERNIDGLGEPRARTSRVRCALWSEAGELRLARSDEFAGSGFVAQRVEVVEGETHVRFVGKDEVPFQMHVETVPALPLDVWAQEQQLVRLDLVKLDVEGAETHVLEGARHTFERLRPILVTEYNPSCATSLFGEEPDAYFRMLERHFATVKVVEPDGTTSPPLDWALLIGRLEGGKGWEDLFCEPF